MRTTLKIVLPLIVSVAVVSLFFAAYQVRTEKRVLRNDLSHRAEIQGANLQESIEALLDRPGEKNLPRLVERFSQREHLKGVVVHDAAGGTLAITSGLAPIFRARPEAGTHAQKLDVGVGQFLPADQFSFNDRQQQIPMHAFALPLHHGGEIVGTVALFHDTSYIDEQVSRTLRDSVLNALFQTLLISGLALVLVRWTFTEPLTRTANWLRTLRTGQPSAESAPPKGEILDRLHHEVTHLANDLHVARAVAEVEARLRDSNASIWTAERLRVSLRNKLQDKPLFLVSNREPYMHVFNEKDKSINMIVPASGVVTALEPVLLACNGTWIANGSGHGHRDAVEACHHLGGPPDHPRSTRRPAGVRHPEVKRRYQ